MSRLDPDASLIIENLATEAKCREAAGYICDTARELGIDLDF